VIGDSIAFGTGVEADLRFSGFIDRALGKDIEVLNAVVCGWGNDQELIYFESAGRLLKPDVVVLTLTIANDVVNNMLDHLFLGSAPKPRFAFGGGAIELDEATLSPPAPPVRHRLRNLLKHSRLFVFVKRRFDAAVRKHEVADAADRRPSGFDKAGLEKNYSHWSVYERFYDGEFETGWKLTEAIIDRFADVCRRDGIELIVFAFPLKIEVDESWRKDLIEHHEIDPARLDFLKPYRRLAEFCNSRGIEFIYPFDEFSLASKERSLYFTKDSHPNQFGNAVAAQVLLDALHDRHDFAFSVAKPDLDYFTKVH
jgi:hypothetical protein